MYDLIIKNGMVIDGTGAPAYQGDVAILDGKIAKIASTIAEESKASIDAQGLTVTPGFIDSHSHADGEMLEFPDMIEKIEQGITTSIGGQCGSTPAPIPKGITEAQDRRIADFGLRSEVYKTFGSMVKYANTLPMGANIMSFVGHGALRKAVVGYENRKPTAAEMEQMKVLLRDAMDNGALGLSFGLIYSPSCYAETAELIELAKVVKEYGGMLSAHIRDEGYALVESVEEFLTIIKAADVKAVFSHHKAMHKKNWGKVNQTLRMLKEAVAEGYDIYCDVYPYIATSTGLAPTIIAKELRALDNASIVKALAEPQMRQKIKDAFVKKYGDGLGHIMITGNRAHPEYDGLRIDEIARLRKQEPFECAFDLLIEGGADVRICNFALCEEDVETVMRYDRAMICTDSSVAGNSRTFHPRLKATFPRALARYVRERGVVSLPEMIRKCTSLPASVYGLPTKGLLRVGMDADLCIFNADTITDHATFAAPNRRCTGLNYVLLGGEVVAKDAEYMGKRNGKFIGVKR